MTVPSRQADEALDRLERDISFLESVIRSDEGYTETVIAQCIDAREDIATVRSELGRLRGEVAEWRTSIATEKLTWRAEAAEAEARRLREERDALEAKLVLGRDWLGKDLARAEAAEAENRRLTEGLRERDEIIDCLLQRGHFDPFVPLAAFRKIVPKGAYSVETYDEEKEWLARIEARALLSASPSGGGGA